MATTTTTVTTVNADGVTTHTYVATVAGSAPACSEIVEDGIPVIKINGKRDNEQVAGPYTINKNNLESWKIVSVTTP